MFRKPAVRRVLVGLVVALAFSAPGIAYANEGIWAALCAPWPPGSPQWIEFFCYLL